MPSAHRNLGPLAELAERDHVVLAAAERAPVASRVLDQLVGLRQPEGAPAAAQPVVEHDGGDLAALARAGAVAQHPAAPEAHGGGQDLAVVGDIGGAGSVCRHRRHRPPGSAARSPSPHRCGSPRRDGGHGPRPRARCFRAGRRTGARRQPRVRAASAGRSARDAAPRPWRRTAPAAWDGRWRPAPARHPASRDRRGRHSPAWPIRA